MFFCPSSFYPTTTSQESKLPVIPDPYTIKWFATPAITCLKLTLSYKMHKMCLPFTFSRLRRSKQNFLDMEQQHTMEKLRPGLTTVYSGQDPVVEWVVYLSMPLSTMLIPYSIVAIHSPNRNPIKLFMSTATGKFWLGDEDMLPRDIPNCRVLAFSYSGSDSIMASAMQLVESLVHNRRVRQNVLFKESPL